jgi:hypothetical protein
MTDISLPPGGVGGVFVFIIIFYYVQFNAPLGKWKGTVNNVKRINNEGENL